MHCLLCLHHTLVILLLNLVRCGRKTLHFTLKSGILLEEKQAVKCGHKHPLMGSGVYPTGIGTNLLAMHCSCPPVASARQLPFWPMQCTPQLEFQHCRQHKPNNPGACGQQLHSLCKVGQVNQPAGSVKTADACQHSHSPNPTNRPQ